MKSLLYAGLALSLAACSPSGSDQAAAGDYITRNDFESMMGWLPDATALTKEHAHSGSYATMVNPDKEFSLTYNAMLGDMSPHKLRGVTVEAWVFLSDDKGSAKLGLQVVDPDQDNKEVFGDGINLSEQVKEYNTWTKVSKEFLLPDNVTYTQRLKVFLWRSDAASPVYLDDLTIKGLE